MSLNSNFNIISESVIELPMSNLISKLGSVDNLSRKNFYMQLNS